MTSGKLCGVKPAHPIDARAACFAALGDPVRLAIADELSVSDRAPIELRRQLGLESNLLAHHLDVLEDVGLIERSRSSGDGRRRYVHLLRDPLGDLLPRRIVPIGPALFVCSANSARSQLAAALWHQATGQSAVSAGTHPAERVHRGALAAARRAGLELSDAVPRDLDSVGDLPRLVVTVCDQAHEEIGAPGSWLHWSIPDPVPAGTTAAFDQALADLRDRIAALVELSEAAA
jgi:protein-tyrosine-phosphatase/DNA-binding transcriptional ArsR family regulator